MVPARAFMGVCTAGAGALAVLFGVAVTVPVDSLDVSGAGGICMAYPPGSTADAAWFQMSVRNRTGHAVRVRTVRVRTTHDVTVTHLAFAPSARVHAPVLDGDPGDATPREFGDTVPIDEATVVDAGDSLNVVGRMQLDDDASAGSVRGFDITTVTGLGSLHTVTDRSRFAVGIGEDSDALPGCRS